MNEKNDVVKKQLIMFLNDVIEGKRNPEDILNKWPKLVREDNSVFKDTKHELYHFFSDKDIRLRDAKYAEYQIKKLKKIVEELEAS